MHQPAEDPVLKSARREALVVFVTWACALVYTVGYCYFYGYGRPVEDLKFVHVVWLIAFPDWIFWGIVVPWSVCFVVSWCFSYVFVRDEDLGAELEESDDLLGGDVRGADTATEGERNE